MNTSTHRHRHSVDWLDTGRSAQFQLHEFSGLSSATGQLLNKASNPTQSCWMDKLVEWCARSLLPADAWWPSLPCNAAVARSSSPRRSSPRRLGSGMRGWINQSINQSILAASSCSVVQKSLQVVTPSHARSRPLATTRFASPPGSGLG